MASAVSQAMVLLNRQEIVETAYDLIKGIKDPEKPKTLEELDVVKEEDIFLFLIKSGKWVLEIHFTPTVPHCHFATVIVNKQLEDKERVAAAMENPNLNELVRKCLQDS